MDEIIEKLEHGLMVCAVTGTSTVHISQEDVEKIIARLKGQFEIVRCKDCEHYTGGIDGYCNRWFRRAGGEMAFCSCGRKR